MAENKKQNEELEQAIEDTQISFVNEDGTEELCQILFTFNSGEKNYMFFYPVGEAEAADEDEELSVYCATYEEKDGEICNIKEVDSEDEEENKMIEEVFNQYLEDCECEECDCEECHCEECEGENEECHDEHCCCHHHEDK